jgi:hypothetical protein
VENAEEWSAWGRLVDTAEEADVSPEVLRAYLRSEVARRPLALGSSPRVRSSALFVPRDELRHGVSRLLFEREANRVPPP